MATTGIWKITTRLDHVIDYVTNIDKTINSSSYKELHNMKEYENLDCNTEELCYVSGINCSTHNAYKDMMFTKEQYNKKDKILGYHAFQSFKEGEISADKAHLIGSCLKKVYIILSCMILLVILTGCIYVILVNDLSASEITLVIVVGLLIEIMGIIESFIPKYSKLKKWIFKVIEEKEESLYWLLLERKKKEFPKFFK